MSFEEASTVTSRAAIAVKYLRAKREIQPGQKVLDVGTGTGILIPFLLEAVGSKGHVTAIDFAERMVEACKSKYAHLSNVNIALQQVEKLDFPSATFDAVTCFGLFPHLENKQKALSQMNRVLKPGGKLIIAHAFSSEELMAHHRNATVVAHDVLPDEVEMKRLLKHAGFTGIHITDKPGAMSVHQPNPFSLTNAKTEPPFQLTLQAIHPCFHK
jgi:ubiquinone/menaquinone biosynthesis C-methylase UbiE